MKPQLIVQLVKRFNETISETKTLYDINETEMHFLTHIVIEAANMGLSPQLTAKLLKAAAHFIETTDEITKDALL